MQYEDNIWARSTEKRLKNIWSRLRKAHPFKRRKRLFSLKFRRRFAYIFFWFSALFMFLYYTDPTIFFRTQIGIMMLVGQFLYSFSVLYAQLMSSIPDAYVLFVDAYWNIGMSVLVLAILYYLYYVVRRQRADLVFKVFQIMVLLVILLVLYVFQLNKDPTVFGKTFARIASFQISEGLQAVSDEEPRNNYVRVVTASPYSVNIVDADTIDVGSDRVRLNGISADEQGKPKYNSCKREVSSIIRKSSEVVCYMSGELTYNREVGECFVVNNGVQEDLNRLIVESGCARDCRRYSGGHYKKYETVESKQLDLPDYCR